VNCLSREQIEALLNGAASLEEMEHTATCDACAEALALHTMRLPIAQPPAGLHAQALSQARDASRRESLRGYSLRVLAAMAAALILLFSGAFGFLGSRLPEALPRLGESIQSITGYFNTNPDFTKEGSTHEFQSQ